jgi:DNA-directed RNA polymerase specialized sigma24 family protein
MAGTHTTRYWWDRDVDAKGSQIRSDLRTTAHEIWERACNQTQSVLGETTLAGELMEQAIGQASRYLDRKGVPLDSLSHSHLTGLMLRCFWTVLQRHARALRRLELVGGTLELSNLVSTTTWSDQIEARVDYERIVSLLSEKCRTILALRAAGYAWKEIADVLGATTTAIKKGFFREIRDLEVKLRPSGKPPKPA